MLFVLRKAFAPARGQCDCGVGGDSSEWGVMAASARAARVLINVARIDHHRAMKPRMRLTVRRFAELVCPPEIAKPGRLDATLQELDLMLAALGPAAGRMVSVFFSAIDQGARLYPACRCRPLTFAPTWAAASYVGTLIGWRGTAGELVRRLKGLVAMCYYELPEVKREIGYLPDPYIAAVSARRLERYGADIRIAETRAAGVVTPRRRRNIDAAPGQALGGSHGDSGAKEP